MCTFIMSMTLTLDTVDFPALSSPDMSKLRVTVPMATFVNYDSNHTVKYVGLDSKDKVRFMKD